MRKRAVTAIVTLVFAALSIFLTSPANAASLCSGNPISGWSTVVSVYPRTSSGQIDYGADAQVLQNSGTGNRVIRLRNLVANGKSSLLGIAGTTLGGNQYGQTGTIGTAPSGAWCSDQGPPGTAISGRLTYWIGTASYTAQVNT